MKKFLSIKLVGHEYVSAFKNEDKEGNQPDYKGDGVAVWIREYEEKEKTDKKGVDV